MVIDTTIAHITPQQNDFIGGASTASGQIGFGNITAGSSQTITFKPIFGIINQPKYLPLCFGNGMVFEFELVTAATDAVTSPNTNTTTPTNGFTAGNTSTSWQISDIRVVGDVVTLDSALLNSNPEYVLSGKALNISYNTYITTLQQTAVTPGNNNMAVNISRAVSQLETFSFFRLIMLCLI